MTYGEELAKFVKAWSSPMSKINTLVVYEDEDEIATFRSGAYTLTITTTAEGFDGILRVPDLDDPDNDYKEFRYESHALHVVLANLRLEFDTLDM